MGPKCKWKMRENESEVNFEYWTSIVKIVFFKLSILFHALSQSIRKPLTTLSIKAIQNKPRLHPTLTPLTPAPFALYGCPFSMLPIRVPFLFVHQNR